LAVVFFCPKNLAIERKTLLFPIQGAAAPLAPDSYAYDRPVCSLVGLDELKMPRAPAVVIEAFNVTMHAMASIIARNPCTIYNRLETNS